MRVLEVVRTARVVIAAAVLATPTLAQALQEEPTPAPSPTTPTAPPATWNGLPDRFQIDAGVFRIDAKTQAKLNTPGGNGATVDFENDLKLAGSGINVWFDGSWRISRRQKVSLNYTRLSREGDPATLQKDIAWGDHVFHTGASVRGTTSTDILTAYYRFAIVRKDRFEIGPTVGVGYLWLSAGIAGEGSLTAGGATATVPLDIIGRTSSITGDIGVYFSGWLAQHVAVRGDLLYISASPGNTSASITDGRLALDWYPWRKVGFGAQYKYYRYRYDRGVTNFGLSGTITYQGAQVFASFLF